ncbi:hypothetical protein DFH07DRAFT_838889 [Mycena maculata]|uniref:Uncharacterized protein n=1 Tax=Mycena maculata TaxID=230809 RepID=A0AAD7N1W1_9AGAR|nr:hypothetical protein DFH07DRAFT_838889 [Mycena maculata]
MAFSTVFLKIRAIAFSIILCISLLWVVLLCVYMFLEWDTTDSNERPIIAVMLLTNALTMIILLILLILPFRAWLDTARFLFLLLAHIGIAGTFTFWNPKFHCPTSTPDLEGVCRLLNIYILIASWIVPVLLIIYSAGLALLVARSPRQINLPTLERESILPMMRPQPADLHGPPTEKAVDYSTPEEKRKHISGLSSRTNSVPASLTRLPPAFFV